MAKTLRKALAHLRQRQLLLKKFPMDQLQSNWAENEGLVEKLMPGVEVF
jgi:hypothetical protein